MASSAFKVVFLSCALLLAGPGVAAAAASDILKPFVLASKGPGDMAAVVDATKAKLQSAGFTIAGTYTPYDGATVIAVTSDALKHAATLSKRGGYGAVDRVAVTKVGGDIEVSYTNPPYWAAVYRMSGDLSDVKAKLRAALGESEDYGTGDKQLTADDLRTYHYTFMMEYFDDPSDLADYASHAEAVKAVDAALAAHKGATQEVYKVDVGKDPEGKEMTLYGVALRGTDASDCSSDKYIMSRIDKSDPRHTAHLPYEMLVYGDQVEALYARFRIAVSWPYLPMVASDTGATFFSIMCAPTRIEDALILAAGGQE